MWKRYRRARATLVWQPMLKVEFAHLKGGALSPAVTGRPGEKASELHTQGEL